MTVPPYTPKGERQTCPLRMRNQGWWDHCEWLDVWRTDRWAATPQEADARAAAILAAAPQTARIRNLMWVYGETIPRTCSFCYGIHPDDAVRLLREGWTVHVLTRRKGLRILEPPKGQPRLWPRVKIHVSHFSDEQAETFDITLDEMDNDHYL